MAAAFFNRSEVVAIVKKYKKIKGKKKNIKGRKGNEEEGKRSPSDGTSAASEMMIWCVHLGSQCY